MTEDQFDKLLRESASDYNKPPALNANELWANIEAQAFDQAELVSDSGVIDISSHRRKWYRSPWLGVAAALIVGIGIGRTSTGLAPSVSSNDSPIEYAAEEGDINNDPATLKYIGQTVALLASFDAQVPTLRSDSSMHARASELLFTTRIFLDERGDTDPMVRSLLEDLELVLVQIVQMSPKHNPSDVDIIKEAMLERDVMPRLIAAATTPSSIE